MKPFTPDVLKYYNILTSPRNIRCREMQILMNVTDRTALKYLKEVRHRAVLEGYDFQEGQMYITAEQFLDWSGWDWSMIEKNALAALKAQSA